MATGRLPDPNSAPVTAKGDLYTYSTVPAKLAVGNNGETLVADSSTSTGLRWQTPKSVNYILNSDLSVWQRGTSFTGPANNGYTADRWCYFGQNSTNYVISRQATGDTTNLPFIQYCIRYARSNGATNTNVQWLSQSMESAASIPLAGKTVTLSFYARRGANFSGASNQISVYLSSGTGTDQNKQVAYTGNVDVISSTATLTTTWQRFTYTGTVGATATELTPWLTWTPSGTAGANDYFEVTGLQLEIGSVATQFQTATGTLAGELCAAQRYYYVLADASAQTFGTAAYYSSTDALGTVFFPVTMRTAPTFSAASGSFYEVVRNSGANALSGIQSNYISTRTANIFASSANGASGTAGHGGQYRTTSASANIAFSAEL